MNLNTIILLPLVGKANKELASNQKTPKKKRKGFLREAIGRNIFTYLH
jgi:hypothetical protein